MCWLTSCPVGVECDTWGVIVTSYTVTSHSDVCLAFALWKQANYQPTRLVPQYGISANVSIEHAILYIVVYHDGMSDFTSTIKAYIDTRCCYYSCRTLWWHLKVIKRWQINPDTSGSGEQGWNQIGHVKGFSIALFFFNILALQYILFNWTRVRGKTHDTNDVYIVCWSLY